MTLPGIEIRLPQWVAPFIDGRATFSSMEDRMGLAIALADQNAQRGTGGPFGAAVFESVTGKLVAVGVNLVVPLNNSVLHAEIVAFMMAEARLASYSLGAPNLPGHELVTSCEPCAMCLGATLWAGVRRVVCGATREDASEILFDEGPVFPESWHYLAERGIEVVREVLRSDARAALAQYARQRGTIYNG